MSEEEKKEEGDVLKQGKEFEQADDGGSNEDAVSSIDKKDIVKFVAIGVAALFLIIGGVVIYSQVNKGSSDEEEEYVDDSSIIDDEDLFSEFMDAEADVDEEVKDELRAVGYTGYDIEEFISNGDNLEKKVKQARKAQQQEFDNQWSKYIDGTSDAFKDLMNKTWLGGKKLDVPTGKKYGDTVTTTKNLDYVKIDPAGFQFYIRLSYKGGYLFMNVTPDTWQRLPKSGNIVVNITEETYGGVTAVTNIVEQSIVDEEDHYSERVDDDQYDEYTDSSDGGYDGFFD